MILEFQNKANQIVCESSSSFWGESVKKDTNFEEKEVETSFYLFFYVMLGGFDRNRNN